MDRMIKSGVEMRITDSHGLHDLVRQSRQADSQKSAELAAAKQFEAVFIQMMLESMRKANENFQDKNFHSKATKLFQDLADKQLVVGMTAQGRGLGLAEQLITQIRGHRFLKDAQGGGHE